MTPNEKSDLKAAIKEAFDEELKPLYIDREQHYQDHLFLKELRLLLDSIKNNTVKTIVIVLITGLVGAITTGLFFWAKTHLK